MAATFESAWRAVAAQASAVPPLLVRKYTRDAYQEACQGRRWSFLRRNWQPQTTASRAVDVTATVGDEVLTAAAGQFVAADLNRQIRGVNQGVPYTIVELNAALTEATLDQAYAGSSGPATLTILDAFLFMPADFDGMRTLSNLVVQRPMPWWFTTEELDYRDPNRIWSDSTARMIAAKGVQQLGTLAGRQVYEWWPYPSAQAVYQASYYGTVEPADTDLLQGVLATKAHVIETGALLRCAMYPGTREQPNPYFSAPLRTELRAAWEVGKQELSVRDEDTSPAEEVERVDWRWVNGALPMDTHLLRSTDATLGDYWGGGGGYPY